MPVSTGVYCYLYHFIGGKKKPQAVFKNLDTGEYRTLSVGEEVLGIKVVKIGTDAVVVRDKKGREVVLEDKMRQMYREKEEE